jgi:hypothetical protein
MAKMSEDDLLAFLEAEQAEAFAYNDGVLAASREQAMRDYLRYPYGTEQDGRSQVVTSDVFDTVEGILPDLVEVFVSSDKAVVFDPVEKNDEEGAKQATNACNHVFYKQNNGFLLLYTAAKDALMLRTGGMKWYWEVKRTPNFETFIGDEMQIALHLITHPDAEVIGKEEIEPDYTPEEHLHIASAAMMGVTLPGKPLRYKVRLKTIKQRGQVRVVALPAYELEVSARHNSILLDDCPYVCHKSLKTLSDINEMGFDVTEDDVKAAHSDGSTQDQEFYDNIRSQDASRQSNDLDPTMVRGWLREEYVLCDRDGDGVAERLKVIRLGKKILECEEFSHVPIAAWTPYILTHKFDGISVADLVTDFQKITTDILRNQIDNLALANNQETVVLTDAQGNPRANIDDLLNRRVGGVIREQVPNAVRPYTERWQGIEAMPMVEMVAQLKEKRTGYSPVVAGLDADALNKTATEVSKQSNERQKRMKMMARIMAECLVKPMFRGIFKTLTDYCMEKLSFRLNGQYVNYDPQEWRDGYDMTINVGIGTGDTMQQTVFLQGIAQAQIAIAQSPFGPKLVNPEKIYNVHARLAELAGFKNPEEFWSDPKTVPDQPPQTPPQIVLEQMKGQIQMGLQQAKNEVALTQKKAELELQAANDARDSERERAKAEMDARIRAMEAHLEQQTQAQNLLFQQWKAQLDAATKITTANIQSQTKMATAATQAAEREAAEDMPAGDGA